MSTIVANTIGEAIGTETIMRHDKKQTVVANQKHLVFQINIHMTSDIMAE